MNPGDLPPCGLWQAMHSPCAPGCCTFAVSIFFPCSSWQVRQRVLLSALVRTTFPSLGDWWQLSHILFSNGLCRKVCISFGFADWCGLWHCRQLAVPKGCPRCAFCSASSLGSWQSTQSAGTSFFKCAANSIFERSPFLCVRWQVSHPMSRAAWRLPSLGTSTPILWQERQRFSSRVAPDSAFNSWLGLSEVCGSWHFTQSRTAGGCI